VATEWIAQAAQALEHAHALGIVHRNIMPSNLLVDNEGKLWVTDFGVARFGDDAGLTLTGDLVGTLRYMSPEQALGQLSAVGPRSDVYSLGATLYELLASRPVFDGDDRGELLRQVAFDRPAALRKLVPRLPRDLETIAHKAVEKLPDDRYASAGEMAADLRRFLRGEPIRAKPPTPPELAMKWCVRHRRVVVSAAAILLMAVAGLLTSTLLIARSRDDAIVAQKVAEERYRENRRMLSITETGLAMQAYQQGDLARANGLLNRAGLGTKNASSNLRPSRGKNKNEGGHPLTDATTAEDYRMAEWSPPSSGWQERNGGEKRDAYDGRTDDFRNFAWHWLRQAIDAHFSELKTFGGHPGEVYEVDYSADGNLLAAACDRIVLRERTRGDI
jgi:hypothetical protein